MLTCSCRFTIGECRWVRLSGAELDTHIKQLAGADKPKKSQKHKHAAASEDPDVEVDAASMLTVSSPKKRPMQLTARGKENRHKEKVDKVAKKMTKKSKAMKSVKRNLTV